MLHRLATTIRRIKSTQRARGCAVESLEQRQLLAVSPIVAGTKIKGINLSQNGVSTNQTLITIPFTGNINLVDASKLRLFGYAINPLSSNLGQIKKTVNVVKAEVITADANGDGTLDRSLLQITTDRLMRKGGTIILNEGALTDDNGDTLATQTLKTTKGQNKERFTLACRAFTPGNFNRFTNDLFAASPTPASASGSIAEATVTINLDNFLARKVALGVITQAQKDAAMTRYNSDAAKGTVPAANLRAALFSLTGTFAESAIASYLDGANLTGKPYTILAFQNPDDMTVPVAQTSVRPSDGRLRTVFKPEFQGESFQALSAWVAHEAIHQDGSIGLQEEEFATTVEVLIVAQQAQTDPAFLKAGTKLINTENEKLYAMLNSGRAIFPYVGLLSGPIINASAGVFPGQKSPGDGKGVYTSFENFTRRPYEARGAVSQATDTNPTAAAYYLGMTGKTMPAAQKFNDALIADIDSFQGILGTKLAIALAGQLKLGLS